MIIACPHCQAGNRLEAPRLKEAPNCGACHEPLLSGKPLVGTTENVPEIIKHASVPVIIDFWATWCGPCQVFAPSFASAAEYFGKKAIFIKVDTDAEQALGAQFQIRSIPTLIAFDRGQQIERLNGAMSSGQFKAWVMGFVD
ncbi:thioredoxin [Andreprevotia lacus DSM 23236]|jgi:thioredoxin 2|uniref:Thioredoxin n=1 Tax=Andreprevotia lacus DSM 23236 TaxID=1121001 RepID=A0A1W1XGM4_9NEIS|nr:thioredoxin TrxC [Andreprevotia lacus]SMC23156.1 thioredoxin [Andreprevotia lacus DSM 23236]